MDNIRISDLNYVDYTNYTPGDLMVIVSYNGVSGETKNTTITDVKNYVLSSVSADTNTFVTGFTYLNNTFTIYDNSGSTFNTSINDVTGLTINGDLTITGTTEIDTVITNVISATTYQNLPLDITVTGGTFNNNTETLTFTNNSGGTFNVTGITDYYVTGGTFNTNTDTLTLVRNDNNSVTITGITDYYVTGFTYLNNTFTIYDNSGNTFNSSFNSVTGLTINGNLSVNGNTNLSGITNQIGNVNMTGNTNQIGNVTLSGNTNQQGYFNITGNTFMSGNFCMNNMNSTGQTGTNCFDTSLIPTGTTVTHQFQSESGVLAHLGDLATGEPNSKGYLYMENNVTTTVLPTANTSYIKMSGTTSTIPEYLNLFTTGSSSNELIYNYPPATGATITYLKYNISYTARANQNGKAVTFALIKSPFPYSATTVTPAAMTNYMQGSNQDVTGTLTGIVTANHLDKFWLALSNSSAVNTFGVTISDVTISLFT